MTSTMTPAPAAALPLGHTWITEPRDITENDLAVFTALSGDDNPLHTGADAIVHGTLGQALFTGFLQQLNLSVGAIALLDTHWSYTAPIRVGDSLTCRITHTRKTTTRNSGRLVINRYVELFNQNAVLVQHGTSALLADASGVSPTPAENPGSVEWGRAVADILADQAEFSTATANYDGAFAVAVGDSEVTFRIYRSRIIDVTRRSLNGADFTQHVPENVWWQLMQSPTNDLMKKAMLGKIRSSGNGAEYLRMTKVLTQLIDAARTLNDRTNQEKN